MAGSKQRPAIPFPSKDMTVDLVARCQAGDVEAFETLYRQHSAKIYTLASRMAVGNTHSMRATFGDGSATLAIRTFGGDIIIAQR